LEKKCLKVDEKHDLFSAVDLGRLLPCVKAGVQYELGQLLWDGIFIDDRCYLLPNPTQAFNYLMQCDASHLANHEKLTRYRILLDCIADHSHVQQFAFNFLSTLNRAPLDKQDQSIAHLCLAMMHFYGSDKLKRNYDMLLHHMNALVVSFDYLSYQEKIKFVEPIIAMYQYNKDNNDVIFDKMFIILQKIQELQSALKQDFAKTQYALRLLIDPQSITIDFAQLSLYLKLKYKISLVACIIVEMGYLGIIKRHKMYFLLWILGNYHQMKKLKFDI